MTSTQNIRLEQAQAADLGRLVQLHADAFAEDVVRYGKGPLGYDDIIWHRAMLSEHSYLKIMVGRAPVGGIIVVDKGQGHFFLDTLFVHPDYQNMGVGQRAMAELEQLFPNATRWTVLTPHRNYRNHAFYEKLGYRKIGEITVANRPGLAGDFCLFSYERLVSPGRESTSWEN
jgi:ribosomal protein S18 acetylase RimI-like enzyme